MGIHFVIGLFVLLLHSFPCTARSRFRFALNNAVVIPGFGWPYLINLGRIGLQKYLTAKYPNMVTEHVKRAVPISFTAACDAQYEAWAKEGYDLIIGSLGDKLCFERLAVSYPNTTFVAFAASSGAPPNFAPLWVRFYEVAYLAGYVAGLVTKTKKVCVSATIRSPPPVMDVSGFCRGVRSADPAVEVHILETGVVGNPLMDVWNVNQSYALGCDVVFPVTMDTDGVLQASRLGMMSIGFFSDARLAVGDFVITSAWVDHVPIFVRTAEAILSGTFAQQKQRKDWWMGWDWGAMVLADLSFLVPPGVASQVQAQTANVSRVFCGRVCTESGCLCNASDCCVTDDQLYSLVSYPDFVIEHGVLPLPGRACQPGQLGTWRIENFTVTCSDCPAGTYAHNVDQVSECRPCPAATYSLSASTTCTACPAGTYNDKPAQEQCSPCLAGTIAANLGATTCNMCPSGLSSSDGTQCTSASLAWLGGVGGGVALAFLFVGLWAWHASRKMRQLRKQFSNDRVAAECAAAIACLDLQAVAWLSKIPKPNHIQSSFIRIVQILDEVRKYVPDQLLEALATGAETGQELEGESAARSVAVLSQPPSPKSHKGDGFDLPHAPGRSGRLSHVSHRNSASNPLDGGRLFLIRKVTYMVVRYDFWQHEATAGVAEHNVREFLCHLIDAVKAHGGTVGHVLYDHAVVHWGAGRLLTAEAPLRAVETALALKAFPSNLQGGAELTLNVAIGCGNALSGVVETATSHYYVIGGGQVPLVQRMASKNWNATLETPILITDAVWEYVRYSVVCHPRLMDGEDILWEPLARMMETGTNEWMYQLQEGENQGTVVCADSLLGPFLAMRKGDFPLAESQIREIRQRWSDLTPADLAALTLLETNALTRTRSSI